MTGIYKITSPTGRIYIGQSRDISRRFTQYRNNIESSLLQRKLYNSFKKYGVESHIFEIIKECDISSLNQMERYYQILYNSITGLNCRVTSDSDNVGYFSEETKRRIKEKATGRIMSDDSKRKMSLRKLGGTLSREHIDKISASNKGKKRPPDFGQRLSKIFKGKKASQETKDILRAASTKKKPIAQYDLNGKFICSYESTSELIRVTGITHASKVANNQRKTAGGYTFKYL